MLHAFFNPLTQRHTPGFGSGYSQAPGLAGSRPIVLHTGLIPGIATYLTEGLDLRTPRLQNMKKYGPISRYVIPLSLSPTPSTK